MSLDDLPTGIALRPADEAKTAVRRVGRAASYPDKNHPRRGVALAVGG